MKTVTPKNRHTVASDQIAKLLPRCGEGDADAWEQIIRMFSPLVWTVARSHGLTERDCEDVYQLTWQRLVENLHTLTQPERLGTWLVTVAKREALSHTSKARKLVSVDDPQRLDPGLRCTDPTPEELVLDRTGDEKVLAEIRRLPDQHQALLGMLFTDPPLPYETISRDLGLPRGSIGPMRQRILRRIREGLDARQTSPSSR